MLYLLHNNLAYRVIYRAVSLFAILKSQPSTGFVKRDEVETHSQK